MGEHFCEFIIGWTYNPMEEVHCDAAAPLKLEGRWYCARHYDSLEPLLKPKDEGLFAGCDFSLDGDCSCGYYHYEFGVINPLDTDDPF
jgi:hypothetical protein